MNGKLNEAKMRSGIFCYEDNDPVQQIGINGVP